MLRKGQKELVETYRDGYCGVPAIPGGGKTFALTQWAVEILTEGICKPGKVLIVTYMNSAVNNFKQRISAALEKRGISSRDYYVSTIHSLCLQIIKEKPDFVGINSEVEIIEQSKKNAIIRDTVTAWKRNEDNLRLYAYYLDESYLEKNGYDKVIKKWDSTFYGLMSNAISDFKTNGISPKEAIDKTKDLPITSLLKIAANIYSEYEKKLRRKGLIDFEDMLGKAKFILENDKTVLEKFRRKYTYVCEDEAQDSNKVQTEILTLIAGEKGNFLRVGDSNQAIMTTFANSDMKLFKEFCSGKKSKVFHITQSSRNTKQIIDTANSFVDFVINTHPTHECRDSLLPQYIETVGSDDDFPNPVVDGEGVFFARYKKKEEEFEGIVDKCEKIISEFPDKTTAVLLPDSYKIKSLINLLEARKIKYEYLDNSSDERNITLIKLGRIIDFIASPDSNEKLIDVVTLFLDEEEKGREELLSFLKTINIEEVFYPITGGEDIKNVDKSLRETKAWNIFIDVKDKLKDFLEFPFTVYEKLVLYIAEKLEFSREEMAISEKVASGIKFLMEGNLRYKLSDLAFELLQPKNSFNYFANLVYELKGYEAKPGVVSIATYHKSKGLEWDNVFLGSITNEDFPAKLNDKFKDEYIFLKLACRNPSVMIKRDFASITNKDASKDFSKELKCEFIAERARLLYVGITRAKERLFLSTTDNFRIKASEYFNFLTRGAE